MSYFTADNQTLYLTNFNYNKALLLQELSIIIVNNGGIIEPVYHTGSIVNREIDSAIDTYNHRISVFNYSLCEGRGDAEKIKETLADYEKKINDLKLIDNSPRKVSYLSYITFKLDGFYYYIQIDDNPFFDHYMQKTPIIDGMRSKDACLMPIGEEVKQGRTSYVNNSMWLFDCLFDYNCKKSDFREIANILFNRLINSKPSKIIRDIKRVRVSNTYNNSYHYESIIEKERKEKVDF
jgi:hypothetical protein